MRLLEDPEAALSSRLDIIDAADSSIDLQYFIWQNDATGILVIEKILAAADRGVRVRALLDDIQLEGLVNRISVLDDHPNVEIRIFNPFSVRVDLPLGVIRLAEFAIDGNRLNHRMHNKLLLVDNQVAVLGGRNIGDDYFGYGRRRNFIDTDIVLSGAVVPVLSTGFDAYWNSRWVFPVTRPLMSMPTGLDLDRVRARIDRRLTEHPELRRLREDTEFEDSLLPLRDGFTVRSSGVVIDNPDVSWFGRPDEIAGDLTEIALRVERDVLIVTPYLIPTPRLLDIAATLVARGVRIRVLTNSLGSNDAVIAHSAYSRFRERVIALGIELYELRGDPALAADDPAENISLHSKYIIFDEVLVFVGSANLDPRSLYLNTELGVILDCPLLAHELRGSFERLIGPENAWRVLSTQEGLRWQSAAGTVDEQPAKGNWQRFRNWVYGLLPLHSQM